MLFLIFGIVVLVFIELMLYVVLLFIIEFILVIVFGGFILGFGVGFVICYGGLLDGIEIMGILLMKKLLFFVGEFVMFVNLFIFVWVVFVFGVE